MSKTFAPRSCGRGSWGLPWRRPWTLAGVPISPWQAYCGLQGHRKRGTTRLIVYGPAVGEGCSSQGGPLSWWVEKKQRVTEPGAREGVNLFVLQAAPDCGQVQGHSAPYPCRLRLARSSDVPVSRAQGTLSSGVGPWPPRGLRILTHLGSLRSGTGEEL